MVRAHGWLLCIASCTMAMAQTAAQKPGRIEGSVVNSVTGAGVKKAEVTLNGGSSNQGAITDATGHFAFESVTPGQYWIQVNCQGYSSPPGTNGQKPVKVGEEQEVKDLAMKMVPLGIVAGVVRDQDGEPMVHVMIQALRFVYVNGRRQLIQTGFNATNDRGEFRMFDLQPAKYYLQAMPLGMARIPAGAVSNLGNEVYPFTFYPSGVDLTQAAPQQVKAGEELSGLEFRLKKMVAFHLRGRALDVAGGEGGGTVQVYRDGRPAAVGGGLQPDGAFDIHPVTPGEYTLVATKNNGKGQEVARQSVVVSDHDVNDLILTAEPGFIIKGSASVEGEGMLGQFQVGLGPRDGMQRDVSGALSKVKDDGSFEITGVTPETYTLNVNGMIAPVYLKSIRFAGQEIADGAVDLTQQRGGEIQLVFGSDGGKITGTTAPFTTVTATLVDGPPRNDQFHLSTSDPNGNFQFQGLAPGKYLVLAWESNDANSMQIPELRKQLESKGAKVTLSANGNESVQVTVIPAADIAEAMQKLP